MAKRPTKKAESETQSDETFKLESQEGPSKMDMVREALQEGHDSPEAGVAYIQEKYNAELSRGMFSTYKASIKRHGRGAGDGDLIDSLAVVKSLVAQYGADRVKKMIDLFA
jgi:hypothetical protein